MLFKPSLDADLASRHGDDWLAALLTPAVFWRPQFFKASPVLQHLPFLFWLMESKRPRNILQIGVGDGVCYLGLCQAAEKLDLCASLVGVLLNGEEPSKDVLVNHEAHYADISHIMSGGLGTAPREFEGAIDLLLLLGDRMDDATLSRLAADVLPLLSESALILQCRPAGQHDYPADLFGQRSGRSFNIPGRRGGHDIEVLLHGENHHERLRLLAAQMPGRRSYVAARQVFGRLGLALDFERRARDLEAELGGPLPQIGPLEAQLVARGEALAQAQAQAAEALQLEAEAIRKGSLLAVQVYELGEELGQKRADVERLCAELAEMTERLSTSERERDALRTSLEAANEELSTKEKALSDTRELVDQWSRTIPELVAREEQLNQQVATLEAEHRERLTDIEILNEATENELASMREREHALQVELKEAQQKRSGHWKRVEELTSALKDSSLKVSEKASAMAALQDKLKNAEREIRGKDARLVDLTAALKGSKQRVSEKTSAMAALQARLKKAERAIGRKDARLLAMRDSTSWRLTKPLRAIGRAFKSLRSQKVV